MNIIFVMTPTTDDLNRSEEAARAADAKRERLYTLIIVIVGIVLGVALAWMWM